MGYDPNNPQPISDPDPPEEITRIYDEHTRFIASLNDSTLVLKTVGEIDLYSSPLFKELFLEQLETHPDVSAAIVDMTETTYIDATVLGILVGVTKRIRDRRIPGTEQVSNLDIITGNVNMTKIFEITGLNKVFNVTEAPPETTDSAQA